MPHNATQLNRQNDTTDRNTTQHCQQNSPQHNKTGNKSHAHVLNKPVKVTSSSTKNSTEKNSQKTLQVYCITHAQLSKAANRIECEIGCVV